MYFPSSGERKGRSPNPSIRHSVSLSGSATDIINMSAVGPEYEVRSAESRGVVRQQFLFN